MIAPIGTPLNNDIAPIGIVIHRDARGRWGGGSARGPRIGRHRAGVWVKADWMLGCDRCEAVGYCYFKTGSSSWYVEGDKAGIGSGDAGEGGEDLGPVGQVFNFLETLGYDPACSK